MLAKVLSGAVIGVDGLVIQVEVDLVTALPSFSTVGLPEGAVRESKDRVRAAIKNSGYVFPTGRITVNLAPAAVKKEGAGYDLPIAVGILAASKVLSCDGLEKYAVVGELSLDGSVRATRGILPMVLAAKEKGVERFFVPTANAAEAAVVQGIEIIPVERLDEAVEMLAVKREIRAVEIDTDEVFAKQNSYPVDFNEVKGQGHVKRALEVAAAGGHNILLSGVPGTGKTMMARRLPTILPDLSLAEAVETSKIYSTIGMLPDYMPLLTTRPFRSPHHTISDAGLIGGGQVPRPGEVSLAHNGVLFLDELPEFRKHVLEVMRQPMEDGVVTIARAATTLRFPARFMLVAAMNPCPCGHLGDPRKECSCTPIQVRRYKSRLSGPLLDRIDLHVEVPSVTAEKITGSRPETTSKSIRERVNKARNIQKSRFQDDATIHCNGQMGSKHMQQFCNLDRKSSRLLQQSMISLGLSARAFHRVIKIARTIADLEAVASIETQHVAEAIQYRRMKFEE